jgi:immune inhibitor A
MKGAAALLFLGLILVACSRNEVGAPTPSASSATPVAATPTAPRATTDERSPSPQSEASLPLTRDLMDLARRLRGLPAGTPRDAPPRQEPLPVGDRQTFQVVRLPDPGEARRVPPQADVIAATLRLVTANAYFYVEDGVQIDDETLERAGQRFEEVIPQVHDTFGRERSPGVDGDAHITVLFASLQNAGGYVSVDDGYPRAASPLSNEREMVYLDASTALASDETYALVLTHELQHLVHYGTDPDEELWVQEGLSVTAETMGKGLDRLERIFLQDPDVQLNSWDPEGFYEAHYGASGLFIRYLAERTSGDGSPSVLRDLVSEPGDGIAGIEAFLSRHLPGVSFADLFADWATANYLDLDEGPYGYRGVSVQAAASESLSGSSQGEDSVHQFAADYIEVEPGGGDAVFTFDGATTVGALATEPHSGRGLWWSNRGDAIDTTLTRELDLTHLSSATLTFWTWYDIERWYDYGYVEVSTDSGDTWQVLPGHSTTDEDPLSLAYGPGYTGISGGGEEPSWVQETIDLTPFAGQRISLRFEYVTDSGLSTSGWAIDDVGVPELGWRDDAESDGDWDVRGFRLLEGPLPQRFIVRLIEMGAETRVADVPLDADNHAEIRLSGFGNDLTKAVILIAAATDGTSEPATYRYSLLVSEP